MKYERDPDTIYRQSWTIVENETDLSPFLDDGLHEVVVRMVHACAMTDITSDIRFTQDFVNAAVQAIAKGAPILCDSMMTVSGISRRHLRRNDQIVPPRFDEATVQKAKNAQTTQSAMVAESWWSMLAGSLVVIGNAPTALFHLLEMIAAEKGKIKPAAIVGFPVGFVGAAESKRNLCNNLYQLPYITLLGRRGGSAMAAAATNALLLLAKRDAKFAIDSEH